jgi:predicted acylesterase/phospholipase RssA
MAMRNALVLSGGGAWGSWQVGACEHLVLERGLWFDVISGVSVGAINGAALAHGHDRNGLQAHFRRLRDWWFAVRGNHNVYRRRPNAALGMALGRWDSLFDVAPLRDEVLAREIDPVQVAASPVRLCVGYVDLRTRRYRMATNDHPRLRDALLASATIPLLFPLAKFPDSEDLGVDGGLHHAAPLDDALAMLAAMPPEPEPPDVWVLLLNPRVPSKSVGWFKRLLGFAGPSLKISRAPWHWGHTRPSESLLLTGQFGERPFTARLHVLRPDHAPHGTVLDFDPAIIRTSYADGLKIARRTTARAAREAA